MSNVAKRCSCTIIASERTRMNIVSNLIPKRKKCGDPESAFSLIKCLSIVDNGIIPWRVTIVGILNSLHKISKIGKRSAETRPPNKKNSC